MTAPKKESKKKRVYKWFTRLIELGDGLARSTEYFKPNDDVMIWVRTQVPISSFKVYIHIQKTGFIGDFSVMSVYRFG
jgi:hypothetical protein